MPEYRFNVFGRLIAIVASGDGWETFVLGPEGKRRSAEFVVPNFIPAEELAQYLGDLFHENATPKRNDVTQIE
ncbi:DUF7661 family protein [Collimonas fungivorans]|uniref:DUF7661 family protein n=1 Tax=Collimonas fungivorans TaxID=158899 RepID=UPI0007783A60|nr:hypothetical protein [Collimonas fungivorans]